MIGRNRCVASNRFVGLCCYLWYDVPGIISSDSIASRGSIPTSHGVCFTYCSRVLLVTVRFSWCYNPRQSDQAAMTMTNTSNDKLQSSMTEERSHRTETYSRTIAHVFNTCNIVAHPDYVTPYSQSVDVQNKTDERFDVYLYLGLLASATNVEHVQKLSRYYCTLK